MRFGTHPSSVAVTENHTLNTQLKSLYNIICANPSLPALLESKGFQLYWTRLGTLIDKWLRSDANITEQSLEMGELFREVMGVMGMEIKKDEKDGKVKATGKDKYGEEFATDIGFGKDGRCARPGCHLNGACTHGR
ncbi:MAG: hypothetical protein Q9200_001921 [Gallowayella weberi]